MTGSVEPAIFISYAHADGQKFARDLRDRLLAETPPLPSIWLDREEMEGGIGWWGQITRALERSRFAVLVMTEAAAESKTVRREWRHARREGCCVHPVKASPDLDFDRMPPWMTSTKFYDLEHEWGTFVRHLRRQCVVNRVPYLERDLPERFVPRAAPLADLKRALIDERVDRSVRARVVVHGADGLGKTTLAEALCLDDDVTLVYFDGVLWVDLGPDPEIEVKLASLYATLAGRGPEALERTHLVHAISERLEDQSALLVIDDVHSEGDAQPFLEASPSCSHVITTRFADLYPESARLKMPVMTPEESLAFFGQGATGEEGASREAFAGRLGGWPLLIELARAWLARTARTMSISEALTELDLVLSQEGPTAFDRPRGERSMRNVLEASVELLSEAERESYEALSVLGGEEWVLLAPLTRLWGLDERALRKRLSMLEDLSLVRVDWPEARFRLHPVMRGWLGSRLDEPANHHSAFVEAYESSDRWSDVEDDGYIHMNLSRHLLASGNAEALHTLLAESNSDGSNAWLRKLEPAGRLARFAADVAAAWDESERDENAKGPGRALRYALITATGRTHHASLPLEVVRELVVRGQSARALAHVRQIPSESRRVEALALLADALPPASVAEALSIASALDAPGQRAVALAALASRVAVAELSELIPEVLELARQAHAYRGLVADAFERIKPYLDGSTADSAFVAAASLDDPEYRARILVELSDAGDERQRSRALGAALAAVRRIKGDEPRLRELRFLAPRLSRELFRSALKWVQERSAAARERVPLVAALAPYAPDNEQDALWSACLDAASTETWNGDLLSVFIDRLPVGELGRALDAILALRVGTQRTELLRQLVPRLDGPLLATAWECTRAEAVEAELAAAFVTTFPESERGRILSESVAAAESREGELSGWLKSLSLRDVGPRLPSELQARATRFARSIQPSIHRAMALAAVAVSASPSERQALAAEALSIVLTHSPGDGYLAMRKLAPHLGSGQVAQAREHARGDVAEAAWLAELAPYVEAGDVGELLLHAERLKGEGRLPAAARIWSGLSTRLEGTARREAATQAIDAARAEPDSAWMAVLLGSLLPSFDSEERSDLLVEALDAFHSLRSGESKARALRALAPSMSGRLADQTIAFAQRLEPGPWRARLLADAGAPVADEELQSLVDALAREVVEARPVHVGRDDASRILATSDELHALAGAVVVLARRRAPAEFSEALARVLEIVRSEPNDFIRARLLGAVVESLDETARVPIASEALDTIAAIQTLEVARFHGDVLALSGVRLPPKDFAAELSWLESAPPDVQKSTLAALAPDLPKAAVETVLQIAHGLDGLARGEVLTALVPTLARFGESFEARARELAWTAFDLLVAERRALDVGLVPFLPESRVEAALGLVNRQRDPRHRATVLIALARRKGPHRRTSLDRAIAAAMTIDDELARVDAMARLAPLLPPEEVAERLAWTRSIVDARVRLEAAARLALWLPDRDLVNAVSIADAPQRAELLARLLPGVAKTDVEPHAEIAKALQTAEALPQPEDRERTVRSLAEHLPQSWLAAFLDTLDTSNDPSSVVVGLVGVAERLPTELVPSAWSLAEAVGDDGLRVAALAAVTPRLADAERAAAAREVLSMADEAHNVAWIVEKIGPHLPEKDLEPATTLVRQRAWLWRRSAAVVALCHRLAPKAGDAVLEGEIGDQLDALETAVLRKNIVSLQPLAERALKEVLGVAPSVQLERVLSFARHLGEPDRSWMLGIACALQPPDEAFRTYEEIDDDEARSAALSALAENLSGRALERARRLARAIQSGEHRVAAEVSLAIRVAEPERDAAIASALEFAVGSSSRVSREGVEALELALPHARGASFDLIRTLARGMQPETNMTVLGGLATQAEADVRAELARETLEAARGAIFGDRTRALELAAQALARLPVAEGRKLWLEHLRLLAPRGRGELVDRVVGLADVVVYLGGPDASKEAIEAVNDIGRAWP